MLSEATKVVDYKQPGVADVADVSPTATEIFGCTEATLTRDIPKRKVVHAGLFKSQIKLGQTRARDKADIPEPERARAMAN